MAVQAQNSNRPRAAQRSSSAAMSPSHVKKGNTRYKTELCRAWQDKGACKYGDKCQVSETRTERGREGEEQSCPSLKSRVWERRPDRGGGTAHEPQAAAHVFHSRSRGRAQQRHFLTLAFKRCYEKEAHKEKESAQGEK